MGMKQAKTLNEEYMKRARELGLLDQKHFRQAVEAYNFQVQLAETLRQRICEEGTSIMVPVGKDGEKIASNPAIADLNKAEILAQKIRLELDGKMKDAEHVQLLKKEADLNDRL